MMRLSIALGFFMSALALCVAGAECPNGSPQQGGPIPAVQSKSEHSIIPPTTVISAGNPKIAFLYPTQVELVEPPPMPVHEDAMHDSVIVAVLTAYHVHPHLVPDRSHGVHAPRPKFTPDPEIPDELRRSGATGTVSVSCLVGVDGKPRSIRVSRSGGPELDASAVKTVRRWRFYPATKDGQPVEVQIEIDVNFHTYR